MQNLENLSTVIGRCGSNGGMKYCGWHEPVTKLIVAYETRLWDLWDKCCEDVSEDATEDWYTAVRRSFRRYGPQEIELSRHDIP